jgi:hypothetical protein
MATSDQLTGQDHDHPTDRLTTAGAAYAAARAALDAALPAGWRSAAVQSLPPERALLSEDRTTAA